MNPAALLSLLSDLQTQVVELRRHVEELSKQLAVLNEVVPPGDDSE